MKSYIRLMSVAALNQLLPVLFISYENIVARSLLPITPETSQISLIQSPKKKHFVTENV